MRMTHVPQRMLMVAVIGSLTACGSGAAGTALPSTTAALASNTRVLSASNAASPPTLVNGLEWPTSFRPFADTSPWNSLVSVNPRFASYSQTVINAEFSASHVGQVDAAYGDAGLPNAGGPGGNRGNKPPAPLGYNIEPVRASEAGPYDFYYSVVYAQPTDPVVTLSCSGYCDTVDHGGLPATIHIPAKARVPGAGDGVGCGGCFEDAILAIIQPDGTEIDTAYGDHWFGMADWVTGDVLHVGGAANCGSWLPSAGNSGFYGTYTGATAGGNCIAGGLIRANELQSGHINHALKLLLQCSGNLAAVYPAFPGAQTTVCQGGLGPPLGARLWYDVPDATTDANPNLRRWEKAILDALHDYGGYFMDNFGGSSVSGVAFMAESGEMFLDFGMPNPYAGLQSQGWYPLTIPSAVGGTVRWVGADPWNPNGVDWLHRMHWLDPCSARNQC